MEMMGLLMMMMVNGEYHDYDDATKHDDVIEDDDYNGDDNSHDVR